MQRTWGCRLESKQASQAEGEWARWEGRRRQSERDDSSQIEPLQLALQWKDFDICLEGNEEPLGILRRGVA